MSHSERAEQVSVLEQLRRDGATLSAHFNLELRSLDAEHPRVRRRYGICYADGSIRIRLRHARTGRPLKYSGLVDTLCHELAHLRYFDHSQRFQVLYRRILARARRSRIYRPDPIVRRPIRPQPPLVPASPVRRAARPAPRGPVQLDLFGLPPDRA